jgi:hypothetical protein
MKHFTDIAISEGKGYIDSDWVFSMTLRDHPKTILIKCSSEQTTGIHHQKYKHKTPPLSTTAPSKEEESRIHTLELEKRNERWRLSLRWVSECSVESKNVTGHSVELDEQNWGVALMKTRREQSRQCFRNQVDQARTRNGYPQALAHCLTVIRTREERLV